MPLPSLYVSKVFLLQLKTLATAGIFDPMLQARFDAVIKNMVELTALTKENVIAYGKANPTSSIPWFVFHEEDSVPEIVALTKHLPVKSILFGFTSTKRDLAIKYDGLGISEGSQTTHIYGYPITLEQLSAKPEVLVTLLEQLTQKHTGYLERLPTSLPGLTAFGVVIHHLSPLLEATVNALAATGKAVYLISSGNRIGDQYKFAKLEKGQTVRELVDGLIPFVQSLGAFKPGTHLLTDAELSQLRGLTIFDSPFTYTHAKELSHLLPRHIQVQFSYDYSGQLGYHISIDKDCAFKHCAVTAEDVASVLSLL